MYDELFKIREADNLDFQLEKTSCIGMCFKEPLVEIIVPWEQVKKALGNSS